MNQRFNPTGWPRPKGYSNVISATGRTVFVAGQIGWDENEVFNSESFVDQTAQALRNIVACLNVAGATSQHIVRMTWYVVDKAEYLQNQSKIGKAYQDILGPVYPVMSLVEVSDLLENKAKLEIEVTAVVPD